MSTVTDDQITGSAITPGQVATPTVRSQRVDTDEFAIKGTAVDGITNDYGTPDYKKLLTSYAFHKANNDLNAALTKLEEIVRDFIFTPVLSQAIASPKFVDLSRWDLTGWKIDNGNCFYPNHKTAQKKQAVLRLNAAAFEHRGMYFMELNLVELPPGACLVVQNYHGEEILRLQIAKFVKTVFQVDYPGVFFLDFIAEDMDPGTLIMVDWISVHYIRPEFDSYVDWRSINNSTMLEGGGFATMNEVNKVISDFRTSIQNYVNLTVDSTKNQVLEHIQDTASNPHQITRDMLNAASADHTHDFLGDPATNEQLLVPLSSAKQRLDELWNDWQQHITHPNPHEITPEKIDAAREYHTHKPSAIEGLDEMISEGIAAASTTATDQFASLAAQMSDIMNVVVETQDSTATALADLDAKIEALRTELTDKITEVDNRLLGKISAVETTAAGIRTDLTNLTARVATNETNIAALNNKFIISTGSASGTAINGQIWFQYI